MKTPRKDGRLAGLDQHDLSVESRRKRTMTAPGCESLEGRKLMTGAGGMASAMMWNPPAEMTDMGGGDLTGMRADHSRGEADIAGQKSWSSEGSMFPDAAGDGTHSFRPMSDSAPRAWDGMGFDGGSRFGAREDGMDGGDAADIPMSGQSGGGSSMGATGSDSQLETDISKLQTDAQAIHDKSQVTPALEAAVRKDLEAIDAAKTGTADATALKTLQTDEQTIFSTQTGQTAPTPPTAAQQAQLTSDRNAVLLSQGVSQTLIDQLATDQLAVKTASNFTPADQATLDADRKAIDADRAALTTPDSGSGSSTGTTSSTSSTTTTPTTTSTATPTADSSAAAATTSTTAAPEASATPSQAPAVAAAIATPTTSPSDPTATQTTSTAAATAATTMAPPMTRGHEVREGLARGGVAHHAVSTHQFEHSTDFGRRGPRN